MWYSVDTTSGQDLSLWSSVVPSSHCPFIKDYQGKQNLHQLRQRNCKTGHREAAAKPSSLNCRHLGVVCDKQKKQFFLQPLLCFSLWKENIKFFLLRHYQCISSLLCSIKGNSSLMQRCTAQRNRSKPIRLQQKPPLLHNNKELKHFHLFSLKKEVGVLWLYW